MGQPVTGDLSMGLPWVAPLRPEPRPTTSDSPPAVPEPLSKVPPLDPTSAGRILGIDIENKPLWYGGGDFVYDNVVCFTAKWVGSAAEDTVWLDWRQKDTTLVRKLQPLREMIEESDALLGHNFKHDWRGIRSVYNHLQQRFLPARPIIDTMRCIPGGMPRSLEWLCDMFDLGEKPHVPVRTWVAAIERAEPWAIIKVIDRNRIDVELTELLFQREKELGWLTPRIKRAA